MRAEVDAVECEGLTGVVATLGLSISGDLNGFGRFGSAFTFWIIGETKVEGLFEDDAEANPEARVKLLDSCDADANPEP